MWGIRLDQLLKMEQDARLEPSSSTREVVVQVIWPATQNSCIGYALVLNSASPVKAATMVSHAWDQQYSDFLAVLRTSGQPDGFWVAATALHQSEDAVKRVLANPKELLVQVLQKCQGPLLCIVSSTCNVYRRLWCLYEMASARELGIEVKMAEKPKGVSAAWSLDQSFLTACNDPVDSISALCGPEGAGRGTIYEQALRRAIEAQPGGYAGINRSVEMARLESLAKSTDRLGGGWKVSEIGRQYAKAIDGLASRLGVPVPEAARTTASNRPKQTAPAQGRKGLTPRTTDRRRHAPVSSI